MKKISNKFGNGILYDGEDIAGKIYVTCCACMSIYAEFLSWANTQSNRFVGNPYFADSIIVLSCQVTDLAVLNDLIVIENLIKEYKEKEFYIGGCLARRFDIPLPENVRRLDNIKSDYTFIKNKWIINYESPFWIKEFDEHGDEKEDGHLFRDMYPLRIGVGCKGKCKYCTIRETRGEAYELFENIPELLSTEDDVVLIADSPSAEQIIRWCNVSKKYNRKISLRNLEPRTALSCANNIIDLSKNRLLKVLHVPIQSPDIEVLKDMYRDYKATLYYIQFAEFLKKIFNQYTATNIIIDYKNFNNPDMKNLYKVFDYISWNPYWNGRWDREEAEKRFDKYFK